MKTFGLNLFAAGALACTVLLSGCGDDEPKVEVQVDTKIDPSEGLDLQLVGGLATKVKSAEELEKRINDPEEGINNLDLDENGEVDYIRVEGFGEAPSIGYSLGVAFAEDDVQEVATLHIEQTEEEEAEVVVQGNRHVYGDNHYYAHSVPRQNFYLYNHMYAPGYVAYRSPYYYGHYPTYYRPYRRVTTVSYRSRTSTLRSTSRFTQKKASKLKSASPYASKKSSTFKRSVGSSTASKTSSGFKKTTGSTASKPSSSGFKKTTGSTATGSSKSSGFKKTTGSSSSSSSSAKTSSSSGFKKSSTSSSSGFKKSSTSGSSSSSFKKSSTSSSSSFKKSSTSKKK